MICMYIQGSFAQNIGLCCANNRAPLRHHIITARSMALTPRALRTTGDMHVYIGLFRALCRFFFAQLTGLFGTIHRAFWCK